MRQPKPRFLQTILMRARRERSKLELAEGLSQSGSSKMCDYSLLNVKSRPANVGDKLTTWDFGTGTRGFAAPEDMSMAVCLRPGTELSFAENVAYMPTGWFAWRERVINHRTAVFRQINAEKVATHHDALEFPDGKIVLLTHMRLGQQATVLQLPAEPRTTAEAEAQQRVAYVG